MPRSNTDMVWYKGNMMEDMYECCICKNRFDGSDTYEYRGFFSCSEDHEKMIVAVDGKRTELIENASKRTKAFKGLDLSDSTIGKANKNLLKTHIELAEKEGKSKLRIDYENGVL